MDDPHDAGAITDDTEVDGSLSVRRGPKSRTEFVPRRALETRIGEPTHATDELFDQSICSDLIVSRDIVPKFVEVRPGGRRND